MTMKRPAALPSLRLLLALAGATGALCGWAADLTSFTVVKASAVTSDPVNNSTNPKAIPGAVICYTTVITNSGTGSSDTDTFVFTNPIPADMALCVTDFSGAGSGPVAFIDGTPTTALSYTFLSLASGADDVSFSNDGGATWTYAPSPDGNGCDPSVTHIRVELKGAFAAAGGGNPNCTLQFRCRVK